LNDKKNIPFLLIIFIAISLQLVALPFPKSVVKGFFQPQTLLKFNNNVDSDNSSEKKDTPTSPIELPKSEINDSKEENDRTEKYYQLFLYAFFFNILNVAHIHNQLSYSKDNLNARKVPKLYVLYHSWKLFKA